MEIGPGCATTNGKCKNLLFSLTAVFEHANFILLENMND